MAKDGRYQCICTKKSEWRMESIGSFVRRHCSRRWVMLWRRMGCFSAFVRRSRSSGWEVSYRLYVGSRAGNGRYRIVYTKALQPKMGNVVAEDGR